LIGLNCLFGLAGLGGKSAKDLLIESLSQ